MVCIGVLFIILKIQCYLKTNKLNIMITKEELARVNIINENLFKLDSLTKVFEGTSEDVYAETLNIFSSTDFRTLINEYIPIIKADLMSEYNSIICP